MRIYIIAEYQIPYVMESWNPWPMYAKTLPQCITKANNFISKKILPLKKYDKITVRIYDMRYRKGERLIDMWTYKPTYR